MASTYLCALTIPDYCDHTENASVFSNKHFLISDKKNSIWSLVTGKEKLHVNKTKLFSFFTYYNIALHCIGISQLPQSS